MTPEKSWHWHVDEDPTLPCRVDKTIDLNGEVLSYTGWCDDPIWGGDFTIGSQTITEFLEQGPLNEQLPEALIEEIRTYVTDRDPSRLAPPEPTDWAD